MPRVWHMGTALGISPIYSFPRYSPATLSPTVTALWQQDLGGGPQFLKCTSVWHSSESMGHAGATMDEGTRGPPGPAGTALGCPGQLGQAGVGTGPRGAACTPHTSLAHAAPPVLWLGLPAGLAGCSVPHPCPCPCPTLHPGDAWWPEGTWSTEPLLFLLHDMGVEEKTPEATFRRTKGQYITFGLTFLWLCRLGEGSTCSAGILHRSTLRKHSQTKAARPRSPAPRRVPWQGQRGAAS